jgi:hypothetical protein
MGSEPGIFHFLFPNDVHRYPEGSFLNGFTCLREKLVPTLVLDLALFALGAKLVPMQVKKKLRAVFLNLRRRQLHA